MIIRDGSEIAVTDIVDTSLLPGFAVPLHDVFSEEP